VTAASPPERPRPLIAAHRGASEGYDENTVAAFVRAAELGCEMVELDVRRTADGHLVCCHDPFFAGRFVSTHTLDDLRVVGEMHGKTLSTLPEVVESLGGRIMLDVELKEPGYESYVAEVLLAGFAPDEFVLSSFHDVAVARLRAYYPELETGLLLGRRGLRGLLTIYGQLRPERRLRRCDASFVAPHWRLLEAGLLERLRRLGLPLYAWTVDDDGLLAKYVADPIVTVVITGRPDTALELREA
jgi:glycerophosphoryl diester phosphodiesterase